MRRSSASSRVLRPLVEDPGPAAPVVGDRVGQPEPADQVEGGLHQLAHAGPRLVGAEQLDGHPVRLAADLLLQRRDLGQQGRVGAGRHPELERGGEDRRGEVVAEHLQHRAGPLRSGRQALAPPPRARRRAPRSGAATAATTRSCLVGKWCSWAPRLTPARSLTSVVDVPAYPFSTSSSTVASSSRARIARVRSSCGTRAPGLAATRSGWRASNKQSRSASSPRSRSVIGAPARHRGSWPTDRGSGYADAGRR